MNEQTLANLRDAATRARIVDLDLLGVMPREVAAQAEANVSAGEVIQQLRAKKPDWFAPSVLELSKRDYHAQRAGLIAKELNDLRKHTAPKVPDPPKPIADMSRKELNRHEDAVLRGLRSGRR